MRYQSRGDATVMRRAALGPATMMRRRPLTLVVPTRGLSGCHCGASGLRTNFGTLGDNALLTSTIGAGQGAGTGAEKGTLTGASIGSKVLPGIGTVVGAAVGAIVGAIAGSIGKADPESANFNQAIAIYAAQGQNGVLNIPNLYLVLAGLFDLSSIHTNIPIYKKYGRMGEQRFVTDMCNLIYQAGQSGQITGSDTPLTVMARIVQPWIDSWGYGPMADPNAAMINTVILGMVAQYLMGGQGLWLDVNGNPTFANLPTFHLAASAASAAPPAQSAAPTVQAQPTPPATPICGAGLQLNPQGTMCVPIVLTSGPNAPNGILYAGSKNQLVTPDGTWIAQMTGAFTLNGIQQALGPPANETNGTANISYDGTNTVAHNLDGSMFVWKNGAWQPYSTLQTAAVVSQPAQPAQPVIPTGFTQLSSTGTVGGAQVPLYLGPSGVLYTLSNGVMTPYAGPTGGTSTGASSIGTPASTAAVVTTTAPATANNPAGTTVVSPVSSGAGSGGFLYPQSEPASSVVSSPVASSPNYLLWGGLAAAAVLLFVMMEKHKGAQS